MASYHPSSFFGKKRDNVIGKKFTRKRAGVSPVIATTIILAITVVLGLALFAYANSGVSSATISYADSVKQYGDFTKDKFVISNIDFNNPAANRISLWIFNSGKQTTNLCTVSDPAVCETNPPVVVVQRGAGPITPSDFCQYDPNNPAVCLSPPDFTIPSGALRKFSFDVGAITPGSTFEITIFSGTGASTSILKCYPVAGETKCTS